MAGYILQLPFAFIVVLLMVESYFSGACDENANHQSAWSKLRSDLFNEGYDETEVPSAKEMGNPLPVTLHLTLQAIREVNEREQSLSGSSTVTLVWSDDRLSWNPSNYSNLNALVLPLRMVWTPSLGLPNTISETSRIPPNPDDTKVHIRNDGRITMETSFWHNTRCPMNLTFFPFDNQSCRMIITSQDTATNVLLVPGLFSHRAEDRPPSWNVASLVAESHLREIQVEYTVSKMVVTVHLFRLPYHYVYTILVPVALINAIGVGTFFIPLKSGERVSTCISVVLGVTIFQIVIIEVMPQTSRTESTPHVIKYLILTFIILAIIMLCSIVTLNMTYQKRRIKNRFLRILFFRILATLVFKRRENPTKETGRKIQTAKRDVQEVNKPNICSIDKTGLDTPYTARNTENDSEGNDMELVATILDRVFFCTFLVVEIWMTLLLGGSFSS